MELNTRFPEFFSDKDGDYAIAQFLLLALKLVEQGRRPDRVHRAMLRAAYDASIQHSITEHRDFVNYVAKDSVELLGRVEAFCDDMLAAKAVAMSNTVAYNRSGRIVTSVQDALQLIGLQTLKMLAVNVAMGQMSASTGAASVRSCAHSGCLGSTSFK